VGHRARASVDEEGRVMAKSIQLPDGRSACACGNILHGARKRVCPECQLKSSIQYAEIAHRRAIPAKVRRAVLERDGMVCRHCVRAVVVLDRRLARGERLPGNLLSFDHFPIPFSKGGRGTVDNVAVACLRCNKSRGDRF
jgi:5-methylcytosine-specific restriction endonuclease McrA